MPMFKKGFFKKAIGTAKGISGDKEVLMQLVENMESVRSTATNGGLCIYVYVKRGKTDKIDNLDFVSQIYAKYGMNFKKHISHLDGKETEVLYIPFSKLSGITQKQQDILFCAEPKHRAKQKTEAVEATKRTFFQRLFGKEM
jgi:hypothetical protein